MMRFLSRLADHTDIALAVAVLGIIAVLVIPMPPVVLDFLLAFNITMALLILLVTLYLNKPLELSVFPGLLLVVTLLRLSLNVASTRLILSEGYAGEVINAFGNFVVKGNYVVGLIIFLILIVIQFVVITKGSGRVSEVAARFTLDAMPGKQMAIDADLNAGLINEADARSRRDEIAREADFYGAMDGASKFVRGDAIAGILITLVNIIGGFVIGVAQRGLSFGEALKTYTLLSIGDGLVTQIPALVVAVAAGIIVTRAASDGNMGEDLSRQLTSKHRPILIVGAMLGLMGLVPGLPTVPFILAGLAATAVGQLSKRRAAEVRAATSKRDAAAVETESGERTEDYLKLDMLEAEIGYALIPLVDLAQGGDLLERISTIRKQLAQDVGVILPPVRIRDNVQLKPGRYVIKLKGNEIASGEIIMNRLLAIGTPLDEEDLAGFPTIDPAFGMPAWWIQPAERERAEQLGLAVVEPPAVLATHLSEVIRAHFAELITRQDVSHLLDTLKAEYPAVVESVVPESLTLGQVQKVFQNLLAERVPIRDLLTILETLADYAEATKEPDILTEYVRMALRRQISGLYTGKDGTVRVLTLDRDTEAMLSESLQQQKSGLVLAVPPEVADSLRDQVKPFVDRMLAGGDVPVILAAPNIRLGLRRLLAAALPQLAVISINELLPELEVFAVHQIGVERAG
jgi:flagellar biosynthesis protein FlhA